MDANGRKFLGGMLSSASFYFSPNHSLFVLVSVLTLCPARGDTGPPECAHSLHGSRDARPPECAHFEHGSRGFFCVDQAVGERDDNQGEGGGHEESEYEGPGEAAEDRVHGDGPGTEQGGSCGE